MPFEVPLSHIQVQSVSVTGLSTVSHAVV
jgi:hypothetical protein